MEAKNPLEQCLHRQLKLKEILISNVVDGKAQLLYDNCPTELRKAPLLQYSPIQLKLMDSTSYIWYHSAAFFLLLL